MFTVSVIMRKIFKEEESIELFIILIQLTTNIKEYQKICNHVRRKQEFRQKNIDETRNYLIQEINQNE